MHKLLMSLAAVAALTLSSPAAAAIVPHVMLGARANQTDDDSLENVAGTEANVLALEASLGRKLAIDSHYAKFDEISGGYATCELPQWDVTQGRTPMITWFVSGYAPHSSAALYTDIAAGVYDDSVLAPMAACFGGLNHEVVMRFQPTMADDQHPAGYSGVCLQPEENPTICGPIFVAAWRHIHDYWAAHAPMIEMDWSPNQSAITDNIWSYFYPGDGYVEWIGGQQYNQGSALLSVSDSSHFTNWYATFAPKGKPMILSETNARGEDPQTPCTYSTGVNNPSPQQRWFYSMASTFATSYPMIQGVVAWSSIGLGGSDGCQNYILRGGGLTSYINMGAKKYFQLGMPN